MTEMMKKWFCVAVVLLLASLTIVAPANAQNNEDSQNSVLSETLEAVAEPSATPSQKGSVTNFPLPRFVSVKGNPANIRRGPSKTHKIDYVFTRSNLPVMIIEEYKLWRQVLAVDGTGGWIHQALLTGNRFVMVTDNIATMHVKPDEKATVRAKIEKHVIGELGRCNLRWCRITAGGYKGWVRKSQIWGVADDEIR